MDRKIKDVNLFKMDNVQASSKQNESASTGASESKFKIKRGRKKRSRTTVTYRLDSETVSKIEELAFQTRNSINDTVQELLDLALDNVEFEE